MNSKMIRRMLAILFSTAAVCMMLTACNESQTGTNRDAKDVATNFKLDFVSGEYSFSGTENGRTYCIRLYGVDNEGNEEDFYTYTSPNIMANSDGAQSYRGTVDLSTDCTPGASYHAYVVTMTSDYKRGQSQVVEGVFIGTYAAPEAVTSAVLQGDTVSVTMDQEVFEAYRSLEYPPESFTLTLSNGTEAVQTATVRLDELTTEDEEYTEGFGPMAKTGIYHHRSGSMTFSGVGAGTYTVTIQADARDGVYFASAESNSTSVTQ